MVPVSVDTMHRTIASDVRPMRLSRLYYRMSNNSGKMRIGTTVAARWGSGRWAERPSNKPREGASSRGRLVKSTDAKIHG